MTRVLEPPAECNMAVPPGLGYTVQVDEPVATFDNTYFTTAFEQAKKNCGL